MLNYYKNSDEEENISKKCDNLKPQLMILQWQNDKIAQQ